MATVLIVDDDKPIVRVLSMGLAEQGYDTIPAYNGLEAIKAAQECHPDVILLDVTMPKQDGIATCRLLKADQGTKDIPVILLSGMDANKEIIRGLDAGAMDFISKPFIFPIVAARVRSAIRIKESHDTIVEINERLSDAMRIAVKTTEEAIAASKSKSQFLANMSHEIRTPMTAIIGFAEMLSDDGDSTLPALQKADVVNTITRNGQYLLSLINDILDLAKVEAGKMPLESVTFSLTELLEDVRKLMTVRAEAKGLVFQIEFASQFPDLVESDPTRLRQILINLISNAIKFTQEGHITLTAQFSENAGEPQLRFDVIDTGIGIDAGQASKLFQPFNQADASITRRFGGTGMGLAICKRLADLMNGDVTLVASEPGMGSHFRAEVSITCDADYKMIDATAVMKTQAAKDTKTDIQTLDYAILVAEDGPDNQKLIEHLLRKAGAKVTLVENGRDAVDAALKARCNGNPFDIILMDLQMPQMGGFEAIKLLREQEYHAPIIALTAHAMDGDRSKCLDAGFDDYAAKPINRSQLFTSIREQAEKTTASLST